MKVISLFNGRDLTGWHMLPGKAPAFVVADGVIETRTAGGSDLFTVERFGNYVLRFEYLLSKVGNSGVLIRCDPADPWTTGVEVQLLAPWTPHRDDLHCTGSLYGYVAVTNRPDETTGIWHSMEIRCDRTAIEVSVDGQLTTVADTVKVAALNKKLVSGAIGFQANHGEPGEFAKFRKVELGNLDADPAYVLQGLSHADARFRVQAREAAVALRAIMVGPLARSMDGGEVMAQSVARQALFDIVAAASAPQTAPGMRAAVAQALQATLKTKPSEITAGYLTWLQGMIR
ncbi:MAG: DUF1080 domain-containing protein [Kiritimatiellae bacterium]|nr:DUF1080 domain-containing protein [Kiritimatiellia bacterium]